MIRRILIALLLTCTLYSEDLYFTQAGSGSHNGTVGNPWSASEASTAGNWGVGAGKISAGDTLHVVGTITSQLTVQGSGTAGNVITILFDSGAKFSAAFWPAGQGAIEVLSKDYITIDGGASGQIGGWAGNASGVNGIVECTDNGTAGTYGNSVYCGGVHGANCNDFTVKNLKVTNIYRRVKNASNEGGGSCIENSLTGTGYVNYVVDNCIVDNASIGVLGSFSSSRIATGFSFTNLTVSKCNWCISVGGNDTGAKIDGLELSGCDLGDMVNWDDESGSNAWHHNGFCFFPQDNSSVYGYGINMRIHNNLFRGPYGTRATSAVYMNGNDWMDADAWVYNNKFLALNGDFPENGLITIAMHSGNVRAMNNTFVSDSGGGVAVSFSGQQGGTNTKNFYSYNNFSFNCVAVSLTNMSGTGSSMFVNYNSASGVCAGAGGNQYFSYNNNQNTFAIWLVNGLGLDQNSNINTATVDANYVPQPSDTALKGLGTDLSAFFTTDYNGTTRTAPYDIGAFKASSSAGAGGSTMKGKTTITGKATIK